MISNQKPLHLSPYMAIYDIVVPNDFSFILEELKTKYCLDNGRNAIPLKYLLLKVGYTCRTRGISKYGSI
ncbi:transposase [Lysinibacillus sp. CTST325]